VRSFRYLRRFVILKRQSLAAVRARQRRGAWPAQVAQGEFFQADKVCLPAGRDWVVRGGADQ
jgi:hypothetical protein